MSLPAHMWVKGKEQGDIEGSCRMAGREGSILVQATSHEIQIPHNVQSGLSTGMRVHSPLTITKEWDRSSPMLYQACCRGELLEVKLRMYQRDPDQGGYEVQFFTIELGKAIVVAFDSWVHDMRKEELANRLHRERIRFAYRTISWTNERYGTVYEDSWEVPT